MAGGCDCVHVTQVAVRCTRVMDAVSSIKRD